MRRQPPPRRVQRAVPHPGESRRASPACRAGGRSWCRHAGIARPVSSASTARPLTLLVLPWSVAMPSVRVALQVLDRAVVLARRQRDVLASVTSFWQIDPLAVRALIGTRHSGRNGVSGAAPPSRAAAARAHVRSSCARPRSRLDGRRRARRRASAPRRDADPGAARPARRRRSSIPAQLAAGLTVQMHRRRPAAGYGDEIGRRPQRRLAGRSLRPTGPRSTSRTPSRPAGAEHRAAGQHAHARASAARAAGGVRRARVGDRPQSAPASTQRHRRRVGAVVVGGDDDALAGQHRVERARYCSTAAADITPGRSLSGNTSGRSMAPVASTARRARTCHSRSSPSRRGSRCGARAGRSVLWS